jgi:hypothetical protein
MIKDLIILYIFMFLSLVAIDSVFATQPLPLNRNPECNKVELIAEMQKGKVKVYLVTHCNYFSGTDTVASIDRCYVTVGELHGKTVSTICKFGGRK